MAGRRLAPDDDWLWHQVTASIRPINGRAQPQIKAAMSIPRATGSARRPIQPIAQKSGSRPMDANGLDANWEKRINRGQIAPEMTVDLHGETLATAHARLNASLARAIHGGVRTILLITGRPPTSGARAVTGGRGVIRASILDWIASSSHRSHIAAIRNAHPRHGGNGALYIIMRRARG